MRTWSIQPVDRVKRVPTDASLFMPSNLTSKFKLDPSTWQIDGTRPTAPTCTSNSLIDRQRVHSTNWSLVEKCGTQLSLSSGTRYIKQVSVSVSFSFSLSPARCLENSTTYEGQVAVASQFDRYRQPPGERERGRWPSLFRVTPSYSHRSIEIDKERLEEETQSVDLCCRTSPPQLVPRQRTPS